MNMFAKGYQRFLLTTDKRNRHVIVWAKDIPTVRQWVRDQGEKVSMLAPTARYWWKEVEKGDIVLD